MEPGEQVSHFGLLCRGETFQSPTPPTKGGMGHPLHRFTAAANYHSRARILRGSARYRAEGAEMASTTSKVTTDHEEIRRWAEERGARPSAVIRTESNDDPGIIRLDFPGYSGTGSLEEISWDEWFSKFDERGLALLYQETTAGGERSNFNKIVSRETAQQANSGRSSRSGSRSSNNGGRSRGKKASTRGSGSSLRKSTATSSSRSSRSARSSSGGSRSAAKKSGRGREAQAKKSTSARGRASSSGRSSTRTRASESRKSNSRTGATSRGSSARGNRTTARGGKGRSSSRSAGSRSGSSRRGATSRSTRSSRSSR